VIGMPIREIRVGRNVARSEMIDTRPPMRIVPFSLLEMTENRVEIFKPNTALVSANGSVEMMDWTPLRPQTTNTVPASWQSLHRRAQALTAEVV